MLFRRLLFEMKTPRAGRTHWPDLCFHFLSWGIGSAGPWYTSAFVRGLFLSLLRAGLWLVFLNLIFGSGNCKCFLETNEKNQSRIMYSASALLAGGQSPDRRGSICPEAWSPSLSSHIRAFPLPCDDSGFVASKFSSFLR